MNATPGRYVRIAELEVDPAQLEAFKSAITEGIEAAVRVEPGVLVLYAVSEKDDPSRIRVFEIYIDEQAYKTHLETPHFRKFRDVTEQMVKSRKLLDAVPIVLGAKAG
jgi:quinol monooxygenase YgiN